jgi:hypothetical protein
MPRDTPPRHSLHEDRSRHSARDIAHVDETWVRADVSLDRLVRRQKDGVLVADAMVRYSQARSKRNGSSGS